ncbi:MAG: GntR family transcriptional regulator [Verrucomicrobiae bacterium]|nr:GntR family transcriptional regulator [Verrucomicrobiae bacterium]
MKTQLNFTASKSKHLADHLREQIQRGTLTSPPASTRAWSEQLSVSRMTLRAALRVLQREGCISIEPRRGIQIHPTKSKGSQRARDIAKVVRVIYYGRDFPDLSHCSEWIRALSERLQFQRVHVVMEKYSVRRLQELRRTVRDSVDLCLLLSLPPRHQQAIEKAGVPALVIGHVAAGVELPFVRVNIEGIIRNATHALLRRGRSRLHFVGVKCSAPGPTQSAKVFLDACSRWPRQPIVGQTHLISMNPALMHREAERFAQHVIPNDGVLVWSPIPLGLIMTALLRRNLGIPKPVEVVGLVPTNESLKVCPPPLHYPFPTDAFVKAIVRFAVRYFETGTLPPMRKLVSSEMKARPVA